MLCQSCATQLLTCLPKQLVASSDIHLGVGPAIEDGFYYDTDNTALAKSPTKTCTRIEEEMKKIVKENFHQSVKSD